MCTNILHEHPGEGTGHSGIILLHYHLSFGNLCFGISTLIRKQEFMTPCAVKSSFKYRFADLSE
jgi:hypothetical protein